VHVLFDVQLQVPFALQVFGAVQLPQLIVFPQLSVPVPHVWPFVHVLFDVQLQVPFALQVLGAVHVPQLIVLPQLSVPVPQV